MSGAVGNWTTTGTESWIDYDGEDTTSNTLPISGNLGITLYGGGIATFTGDLGQLLTGTWSGTDPGNTTVSATENSTNSAGQPTTETWVINITGGTSISATNTYDIDYPPGHYHQVDTFTGTGSEAPFAGTPPAPPPASLTLAATDADKTIAGTQGATPTNFTFTVSRSGSLSQAATINYSVVASGSNPASAADFFQGPSTSTTAAFPSGSVTIPAGQASAMITVPVGNRIVEATPNLGFTVNVADPSGMLGTASAAGNIQGVAAPTVAQYADLAADVYTNYTGTNTAVDGYRTAVVDGVPLVTGVNLSGTWGPGTPNGFFGAAYQDGNQIIVSFRGTDPNVIENFFANLWTDVASWVGGGALGVPSDALKADAAEAMNFLQTVKADFPNANITVTGHSLGGAIAQLSARASGLASTTFNAPGGDSFFSALGLTDTGSPSINYRIQGDQVSLTGAPIGQQFTLPSPYPNTWVSALNDHLMTAVIPVVDSIAPPTFAGAVPTEAPLPFALFTSGVVNALGAVMPFTAIGVAASQIGKLIGFDPGGSSTFNFSVSATSPTIDTVALPTDQRLPTMRLNSKPRLAMGQHRTRLLEPRSPHRLAQ